MDSDKLVSRSERLLELSKSADSHIFHGLDKPRSVPMSTLTDPRVAQYIRDRDKRKKDRAIVNNWKMPVTAAGLLGAGFGLRHLGNTALSPSDLKKVDNFIAMGNSLGGLKKVPDDVINKKPNVLLDRLMADREVDPGLSGSPELFYDYIDRASDVVNVRPWSGKNNVNKLMHIFKDMVGKSDPPLDGTEQAFEASRHYPSFERGPFDAFVHQMKIKAIEFPSKTIKSWMLTGTPYASLIDDDSKTMRTEWFDKIKPKLDEYVKQYGDGLAVPVNDKNVVPPLLSSDRVGDVLSHGQQMDLIRGFSGYLQRDDPALAKLHQIALGRLSEGQSGSISQYLRAANLLKTLGITVPKVVGTGLAVAGGGTLAYWLGKKIQDSRLKAQKERDRREESLQRNRAKRLSPV